MKSLFTNTHKKKKKDVTFYNLYSKYFIFGAKKNFFDQERFFFVIKKKS